MKDETDQWNRQHLLELSTFFTVQRSKPTIPSDLAIFRQIKQ